MIEDLQLHGFPRQACVDSIRRGTTISIRKLPVGQPMENNPPLGLLPAITKVKKELCRWRTKQKNRTGLYPHTSNLGQQNWPELAAACWLQWN